jgi:hypothetical protein
MQLTDIGFKAFCSSAECAYEKFNQVSCADQKTCDKLQGFASKKLEKARQIRKQHF